MPRTLCPVLELGAVLKCEARHSSLEEYQKDPGMADVHLRALFVTKHRMVFEAHFVMTFRRTPDNSIHGILRELFGITPRSEYKEHEHCTPEGIDPAMCPCNER